MNEMKETYFEKIERCRNCNKSNLTTLGHILGINFFLIN